MVKWKKYFDGGFLLNIKKYFTRLCCVLLLLCLLPVSAVNAATKPSQAGERKLEGGQRDFKWPVPGQYNLSSCFLDNRAHYSLDIAGPMGSSVVASYAGEVIDIFTGCEHNWGKSGSCCSSWGNFVLLEHSYTLKSGKTITLYSRYAHLTDVTVSVGKTVARGEKIGTVGSTGRSSGPHLDYEILYGGTSPSKTYSVDPYINDLLELPEELHTTFGKCCQEYVAYVKTLTPRCAHPDYNSEGDCTECGYTFDWKTTRDIDAMGYYTVSAQTQAFSIPYTQSSGTSLSAGETVSVNATVVNGLGETWYEVALKDGNTGYVPKSALKLHSYLDSQIQLSSLTVKNGQVLKQKSHRLDGRITSRYPLRSITGYLDGEKYASWSGTGGVREIDLRGTNLNKKLSFATMEPGEHTLTIYVTDSTGREAVQVCDCTFQIEKDVVTYTVTFSEMEEDSSITVQEGQPLGELPTPVKEGHNFVGWFTEDEQEVTAETILTGDMTLHPKWEQITYQVSFDDVTVQFNHGEEITEEHNGVKDTHLFLGWFTEDGRKIPVGTPVLRDMVLHSQWEPKSFDLNLDLAGGELDLKGGVSATYGEKYSELYTPTREGYVFIGWELDGQIITDETVVEKYETHTLTAVWQEEAKEEPTFWWLIPVVLIVLLGGAGTFFFVQKRNNAKALF